ncbi:hypothetical protein RJT34_20095 [Clitoria ternatea]|uniref:Transcription repressor n=1 Tax=Clitoria ternatea TaxID=43366 RepID=A0AAN9IS87_CLITE
MPRNNPLNCFSNPMQPFPPPQSPPTHHNRPSSPIIINNTQPKPADFATAFASQRFFFSSPGRSNSIVESTTDSTTTSSSSSVKEQTLFHGSVAVPTYSPDPYADFRRSMEEMVEARPELMDVKSNWHVLHELLLCYLALNPKSTHKFILNAFADLLVSLISFSSASPPPPPPENHNSGEGCAGNGEPEPNPNMFGPLFSRKTTVDSCCPVCMREPESSLHVVRDCIFAKKWVICGQEDANGYLRGVPHQSRRDGGTGSGNWDGALLEELNKGGCGGVFRSDEGRFMGCLAMLVEAISVLYSELMGLHLATQKGCKFATDSNDAVNAIC